MEKSPIEKSQLIRDKKRKNFVNLAYGASIPMIIVGYPLLSLLVGSIIDSYFLVNPYGKVIGLILGVISAIREIILILLMMEKEDTDEEKR